MARSDACPTLVGSEAADREAGALIVPDPGIATAAAPPPFAGCRWRLVPDRRFGTSQPPRRSHAGA